ncbi:MAG: exosortase K [Pyrinomonadaceae bacterium]
MRPNISRTALSQLIAAVSCAAAIKLYYSGASVDGLFWVLAPTAFLVEIVTGTNFTYESNAGYMSSDHSFLIAASCSGVNFLITAFLMMTISKLWKYRQYGMNWSFIPLALAVAYFTTIIANTVRITTALYLRRDPQLIWINPDELHRFEGIVIYFGFLLLLFLVTELIGSDDSGRPGRAARLMRRSTIPLAIYYAVTLAIPLANLVVRRGPVPPDFWQHCLFVLITPILLLFPLAILGLVNGQRTMVPIGRSGWRPHTGS